MSLESYCVWAARPRHRRQSFGAADVATWHSHIDRWRPCHECGGKGGTHAARCQLARAEFAGLGPLEVYLEALQARRAGSRFRA